MTEGGRAHRCAGGSKAVHMQDPLPGPRCWRDHPQAELIPKGRSSCGDGWRRIREGSSREKGLSTGTQTSSNNA